MAAGPPLGGLGAAARGSALPVGVVGAGPVGLAAGLLLRRLGVPVFLLERKMGPTTHPQAHFVNARTMEVLRTAAPGGRLARAVRRLAPPLEEWRRFVYAAGLDPHSAAGRAFGVVDHFPDAPSIAAGSGGDLDLRA